MKTKPMAHQQVGADRLAAAPNYFALGAEQGTGKTWMLLNDAEQRYKKGEIDGLLVIAPKGVHTNWVVREIPKHLSVDCVAAFWLAGATKRHKATIDKVMRVGRGEELAVLAMNVDAVSTKDGFETAQKFLKRFRTMMVLDESQRFKNPKSLRTKQVMRLAEHAVSRRISSGTLISNNPLDLFSQYEFLRPGLLGTTSYRAFVAEYADLLPEHHPMVRQIAMGARGARPQVVRRDSNGRPMFRNTDKLARLMAPHTFRVLKADCLDLPEKIYTTHYFELQPSQRRIYESVKEDRSYVREDGTIDMFSALTVINKLRQVTSGFIIADGKPVEFAGCSERISALLEVLEDSDGQLIVWASFKEEMRQIAEALTAAEETFVEYHGDVSTKDREAAVDNFQAGKARVFLANPAAGGTGLTLTAASTVVYFSNSFSLEERLQSEDRAHRIGTKRAVRYVDLVARDTIDEVISAALQNKALVAEQILRSI